MKIAIISSHYPPSRTSCAIQIRDLALELKNLGHEPIVITPDEGACSQGEVRQVSDGIVVLRAASLNFRSSSYLRRAVAEMLAPFIMILTLISRRLEIKGIEAIIWYSPSIFFGPLVYFLKLMSKARSYLILRDMFPEWAIDLGLMKKGFAYYIFKAFANFQYFTADCIGVQSCSNLIYVDKWEKSARRIEVLQNWLAKAENKGSTIAVSRTKLAGRRIFVYIGNMGVAQGMDILIDLAAEMEPCRDLGFLFVGRGSEVERLKARSILLTNVEFFDEIDSSEMPGLLAQCQVGLIALDPRHKSHNIPGKFLTYMQAGLPVMARINDNSDLLDLIKREEVGVAYTGDSVQQLRLTAEEMIRNDIWLNEMSRNSLRLSRSLFSSQRAAIQILQSLSRSDAGGELTAR